VTERHDEANPGAPDAEQPGGARERRVANRREPPKLVQRLRHRRERHRDRGRVYRIAWVTAGFIVVVAGLVMVVFPGPALVVIPIGLAMLSLEFAWAERLLDSTLERGVEAKDMAMGASRRQKIVGIAAIVCALAAAGALGLIYLT
jgi:uncharacterized protein (TIGR02611 family)